MQLPSILKYGKLIKRYKRFLADIELPDKKTLTVHCPNTGSMHGCSAPGSSVVISLSNNPKRKYPWTLELVEVNQTWVGVNTSLTNKLVHEALLNKTIDNFGNLTSIKPEIKVSSKSRLDFLLESDETTTYLEVKNCSMAKEGTALFPDAVTARGTKHIEELMKLKSEGNNAAILFCIQRKDATQFSPASSIDPIYAQTLKKAADRGVMVVAYQAEIKPPSIRIMKQLPVLL